MMHKNNMEILEFNKPITDVIRQRFSCRVYEKSPIEAGKRKKLEDYLSALGPGPLGTAIRFKLAAATEEDSKALKKLGTYGFIKGATGFIIGAMGTGNKNLEDFGYQMERAILFASNLELGTCWLGGSFSRSRFAGKIGAAKEETVPAVTATGTIAAGAREGWMRRRIGASRRVSWEKLFFDRQFDVPLSPESAGKYAEPLEMVRLGPSASNKQPWRIIKHNNIWHFYLRRTPGYPPPLFKHLLGLADVQRLEVGIAMCHFELTAKALGMQGKWVVTSPEIIVPDALTEYAVSWQQM
ncbi:MAG: hypothetical protein JXJ04_10165 [Spirochaetales bacterium]|nr:hypothetical protein [Spirochaetales bacterium]